jgi:hypothetical protein
MDTLVAILKRNGTRKTLQESSDSVVEAFCEVPDIVRVEARHGDATVAGHVDMRLVDEREGLFGA